MIKSLSLKLKNVFLFLLCFCYYPVRGSAKKIPSAVKNVVVFRSKPQMGDMVYVTPLFRAIKQVHPEAKITLVGNQRIEEVTRHNPDIDQFIDYQNNFFSTLRLIKQLKPDFACLANLGSIEGLALLYLSGASCVSVLSWAESGVSWQYNLLKKLAITKPFARGTYVPPLYLALLDPISANSNDQHFRLYFSAKAAQVIEATFAQNQISPSKDFLVGLAPGGSTKDRWWPAHGYSQLANYLGRDPLVKIIFIGAGKDNEAINQTITNLKPEIKYLNFYNQSLDELKATISKLDLIIGNDSGPMVTGDAFDIPQMIFVGPTDAREYHPPQDHRRRILESPDKNINSISLEQGLQELQTLLDNLQ